MTRDEQIRSLINLDGFGLEIGPSYNPLLSKSQGYRVETVDHASAAELREKYSFLPDVADKIEEVDYISDGRPLRDLIGKPRRYDFIFASHVIEHVTDIVSFFGDCRYLLKENGKLILAVPDKRFCFDMFRPLSTVGQAVEAHMAGSTRHRLGVLFDHLAYFVKKNDSPVWIEQGLSHEKMEYPLVEAAELTDRAGKSDEYFDAHAWRFTPSSFEMIVRSLIHLGLIEMGIDRITRFSGQGYKHEFYVEMSPCASGSLFDDKARVDLLRRIEEEASIHTIYPKEMEVLETARKLEIAEAERDLALTELAAMKASTSWAVTEPLRKISRFLKVRH